MKYIHSGFQRSALTLLIAAGLYSNTAAAAPFCEIDALSTSPSPVTEIEKADIDCRNAWFSAPAETLNSLFSENSIHQIQQQLMLHINQYQGEKQQAVVIENLGEFVRAAYYVRYAHKAQYGDFSDALDVALANTINAFLTSPGATQSGREQVAALKSMTIMVDNIRQLPLTMASQLQLLNHFNAETAKDLQFVDALNNLFRAMSGHISLDPFYDDLAKHPEYLEQLHQFILDNEWALGTDADFIVSNTAREMGRLLVTPHESTRKQVLSILESLLERYPLGGKSDKMWVGIAEMINYFAPDKAEALGLKNAKAQLEARVMPFRYECNGPAIVRAQKMTQAQAADVCDVLSGKEADFHQVVNSGDQPVADDLNNRVEVVVFDNNADYVSFSNFLFGNSTNNGGQYLEGNPANPDNQARFVAYRNEYAEGYSILNLEHEYVHYLDGRFNLYGDFNDVLSPGHTVWWLEGFAEYMHYKQGYTAAVELAREQTYTLSEVLATTYDHDLNRIYRWGYLAVRFLMENHPDEVNTLLSYGRQGQYSQWTDTAKRLGSAYSAEFRDWLLTVESTGNEPGEPTPDPQPEPQPNPDEVTSLTFDQPMTLAGEAYSEHLYYVDIPANTREFSLSITGDGDADLYASYGRIAHYYDFDFTDFQRGSNETLAFTPEANGYIKPGRYYLSVTGREAFRSVTLKAAADIAALDQGDDHHDSKPADDLTPIVLEADKPQAVRVSEQRYLAFYVPQAGQTLRVWVNPTQEATGTDASNSNVSLYAASAHWPTAEKYDVASTYTGNREFIEITAEQAGYVHLMLSNEGETANVEVYASAASAF
ncbi:M9 family metallopeptidase [Photobacterium sp. CCB-ST2H9]|uniref:M9 family metallopeptidase n=1 Tax=Photobacterium sp. CCB-ST2H9 TaxID=2912855 RepID=UPI0020045F7B|nr:M9 family metallopeptidase [Photobacterium sp. CCB-ST2H9]UTM59881.1 M9 family metallopeptidase [Photobacterium sp. CCB-ST2H9]